MKCPRCYYDIPGEPIDLVEVCNKKQVRIAYLEGKRKFLIGVLEQIYSICHDPVIEIMADEAIKSAKESL